ncbi:MAG: hypothetical protein J7K40_03525 [candidate division Zixibacteria bacterium]|nr:hypothetical protein [candidate division Zixibacteria bacterium]
MPKSLLEEVWGRIMCYEGKHFHTIRGKEFTYTISGNTLKPNHINRQIPKSDFGKACKLVPIKGPGKINNLVQGPSFVWAIIHDPRISQGEW